MKRILASLTQCYTFENVSQTRRFHPDQITSFSLLLPPPAVYSITSLTAKHNICPLSQLRSSSATDPQWELRGWLLPCLSMRTGVRGAETTMLVCHSLVRFKERRRQGCCTVAGEELTSCTLIRPKQLIESKSPVFKTLFEYKCVYHPCQFLLSYMMFLDECHCCINVHFCILLLQID